MPIDQPSIPAPCPVAWRDMEGDDRRRYCAQCAKHVTQISRMTRREARELLVNSPEDVCVQMDVLDGQVLFEPEPRESTVFSGPGRWRRALAMGAALTISAPAVASDAAADRGSLVEWIASWFTGPPTESLDDADENPVQDPNPDQVDEPAVPVPRIEVLGGAPMLPPDWELERERRKDATLK
jgi:hypothetical protein